jgi:hypothetical protein
MSPSRTEFRPGSPAIPPFREAEVILLRKRVTIEAFVDIANRTTSSSAV